MKRPIAVSWSRSAALLLFAAGGNTPTSLSAADQSQMNWTEACKDWDEWNKAAPPFRVWGNTWYVDTCGISAILITGRQGHVLIDAGPKDADELIARAWEQKLEPLTVRVSTAVRVTGLSRSRIYELIQSGDLETVKVGRATLVRYQSLKALTLS